jgi:regulator of protease activity HflC (stomatin/prohibitin superfamily)/membrane protein implicated in regulation of membrane protease activity
LLKELNGRRVTRFSGETQVIETQGQRMVTIEPNFREKVLSAVADPNLALVLGLLGLLGIYLEFTHPGLILPGVVGTIALILALLGFSIVPVNIIGVLLILVALGLFVAEVKVQGFGLLGVAGVVSMVLGILFLVDTPYPSLRIGLGLAFGVTIPFAIIFVFLLQLVVRAHRSRITTGEAGLIGLIGEARTEITSEGGKVFVNGEWWRASSKVPIPSGSRVRVVEAHNLDLLVERYPENQAQIVSGERMILTPWVIVVGVLVLYLLSVVNVLREYERGVIFRLGRLLPEAKGPGVILVFWPIDRMERVSLRTVTMDVPAQDVITRDNVSVKVNAIVYFRVVDANRAIVSVENYLYATSQLSQTTLRSVLGEVELDDLLSQRESLNRRLAEILDEQTDPWGIKVTLVEVKAVDLPAEMQRAMARQAEAEREKRAKIIHAEGEYQAAERLLGAAQKLSQDPAAMQLRYLSTLTEIGAEQNSTIVFPVPIDIFAGIMKK